jgi:hypothetical protein
VSPFDKEKMSPKKRLDSYFLANAAKIALTVADGEPLSPPVLHINAHGLENKVSLRGKTDGCVYFGSDQNITPGNEQEALNDYVFYKEDPTEQIENCYGTRHFAI